MLIAILMCWAIWTARDDLIFKNILTTVNAAKETFFKELKLLTARGKTKDSGIFGL